MNFLEAFDELDRLDEASNQYNIPDELKYNKQKGNCPGCGEHFNTAKDYEQHITGYYKLNDKNEYEWIDGCEEALKAIEATNMPARTKVGKAGHSHDEMNNISAADLLRYKAKHRTCEICGAREKKDTELVYDHAHAKDGSHSGQFRGILCNQCNLLIGQLERSISKQNSMPYDEYLSKIARYLLRAEDWVINPKFNAPNMYYEYEHK